MVEPTARFWTDAELGEMGRAGAIDMWGHVIDLHQDHYLKIDETSAVLKAGDLYISGVPADCFRVQTIEPKVITETGDATGSSSVRFVPKAFKHPDFMAARALSSQSLGWSRPIYYQLSGVGAPISAPTILTAPRLDSDLALRIAYNPTLEWPGIGGMNPVPGDSDNALFYWIVAHARAKDNEQRIPDPAWYGLYTQERDKILVRLTPRQEQESEVVEDFFSGYSE